MMFLLGRQAMLGQEPPRYLRSIVATRCPCSANVHARNFDPKPLPSITRSYSSAFVILALVLDEGISTLLILLSFPPAMSPAVVDKRSEYSERSGGRGVCFGGGNRGGFGANQIVYGAECGGGSALHRSLNDASESRKCFCAAVVFRIVRKLRAITAGRTARSARLLV